jgi:hypothetical protein
MATLEELEQQLSDYEKRVELLFQSAPVSDFLNEASVLRERADIMLANLRARGRAPIKTGATAAVEVRVTALIHRLESLTTTNVVCRDNAKVLFQEAGQWARHFSTVRMTVATFTITSCTAIMALASKQGQSASASDVVDPVVVLWILGLTVFWIFTIETYHQIYLQRKSFPVFLGKPLRGGAKALRFDWASLVIACLCLSARFFLGMRLHIDSVFAGRALTITTIVAFLYLVVYRKLARRS